MRTDWEEFRSKALTRNFADESLLDGVEKIYSTSQVAKFFNKTIQWVYWGLTPRSNGTQPFSYRTGEPILPERVGPMGTRRFTLPIIREIALSCHRRGTMSLDMLEAVMAKILIAEFGVEAFAEE